MQGRSAPQLFALIVGASLVAGGVLGFFYNASFATGDATLTDRDAVLGVLDVNGWHNVVHLASGALGLALAGSFGGARAYAGGFGLVYLVVAILGLAVGDGESLFGLLPVNTGDNLLHLLIGVAGLGAFFASPSEPAPTTV
jgi:hypothetical protein